MKAYLDNQDLLINKSDEKILLQSLNKIKNAIDKINSLGYEMYMAEHGSFNVMNIEGAGGYKHHLDFTSDMVVASVSVEGIDGGAW